MIETEEQRRWWFATHPEYSWNNKGAGRGRREPEEPDDDQPDYSPEDVDAYVDEQLKYENGPVAKFLESVKREFGTQGDSGRGGQDRDVSTGDTEKRWLNAAGFHADGGGLIVPTWPTVEDLFRLPTAVAREVLRSLEAWFQNQPLLIDPNSPEGHHGLPVQYIEYFLDCGLDIQQSIIILRAGDHRLKPDGVHTGKGKGGDWNREWEQFIKDHPAENTRKRQDEIWEKLDEMVKKYGVDKKKVLLPPKPKRR